MLFCSLLRHILEIIIGEGADLLEALSHLFSGLMFDQYLSRRGSSDRCLQPQADHANEVSIVSIDLKRLFVLPLLRGVRWVGVVGWQ